VIREAGEGGLDLRTSSEVYDDAISAIRADGAPIQVARDFVADMKSIPHTAYPMSAEVAEEAMSLYLDLGGRRSLSYFDSFHIATAKRFDLTLLTSDKYIIEHSAKLGVDVVDLARWKGGKKG
jgi:predicted nucleic acid-binding protein